MSAATRKRYVGSRREFIARVAAGLGGSAIAHWRQGSRGAVEAAQSPAVRSGKARLLTILHTADIHAQLDVHDEFFWENGKPVFKRRGGFATLRTMIAALRRQNPEGTLVVDGGDCLHGSAVAALSKGKAIVPLMNAIGYDLVLPGNWEVVYGKAMLIENLNMYSAAKVCANMLHAGLPAAPIFPPYHVFTVSGLRVGFVGYTDPLTATRQSPAYSRGIRFTHPEEDLARYVTVLRREERCDLVFVLSHMGLAQQLHLSDQRSAEGVDYILGSDTHERVREPLQGRYAKVTEPGAFGSFIAKLDIVVENGHIEEERYALLEVDPDLYHEDEEMKKLVAAARAPYQAEIDRVIGTTRTPLFRYYVLETPMDNLITDALQWKFRTDFAVSNGFRFCPPLVPEDGHEAAITDEYLWSMLPVDSIIKSGAVTGGQILDWLEAELEHTFAKDATERAGGWFVRFKGLEVTVTIGNSLGSRVRDVKIQNLPLHRDQTYTIVGCQREGDPDDDVCRMKRVADVRTHGITIHQVMKEYLSSHSPVAPTVEGRVIATDAAANLLSQVEGTNYRFR
jgi:S-sulfosulfanyl-L-cysteine sulfohydrolase